ncbi:hemin transporter [Mycolicibacillus parakoreensis]|uniref:nitric oxide dioxygenase n=2 Tax=Mycobacteriaceae TaxID=1762 RepID=A0ABY3U2U9_9MYCO|nr:globin domain-containing protein [Mycolicibacillus parakoreensis]MCV7315440.1 hemin transporter [Mycolicibacillus parakoreensis]ULN52096.1 globin domain-containing protein [Mycolicibacillus parakoreensis]
MLNEKSAAVVKETLPVVGAAIEQITRRFYATMFVDHPELERDLFNQGNQARGDQQRALAGAIVAFAALLVADDAPPPDRVLSRIANKHASLGVTPDQYQVVHHYLFAAIATVLGDAVTDEVAAAWDEVYWLMADALMGREADLYAQAGVAAGEVWLSARVLTRTQESPDCIALTLEGVQSPLPAFLPGQYTSVAVHLPKGARQIRQYSISAAAPDRWRITIKKIDAEAGSPVGQVSNFIHSDVFEGDVLSVSHPFGDITLTPEPVPVLLVSAGIGCTPMIGMLRHMVDTGDARPVWVVHADRSRAAHPHRSELADLVDRLPEAIMRTWYGEIGMPRALTDMPLPDDVQVYLCGPLPFMQSVQARLVERGIPVESIHYEVFGPDLWLQVA